MADFNNPTSGQGSNERPRAKFEQGDVAAARNRAEIAISKILRDLEMEIMRRIDAVDVDTRNFANLHVEIFLKPKSGEGRS